MSKFWMILKVTNTQKQKWKYQHKRVFFKPWYMNTKTIAIQLKMNGTQLNSNRNQKLLLLRITLVNKNDMLAQQICIVNQQSKHPLFLFYIFHFRNLFYKSYIIQIISLLMKLFQGIISKIASIDLIQTTQGDVVELTATDLVCFGLMIDTKLSFKRETLRLYRDQGFRKRYFIKIQLNNNEQDVRKVLYEYEIKAKQEKMQNIVELNLNQYQKLPIICLKKDEKSISEILANKLEGQQIEFIYVKEKLFVSRKDFQVLDLLQIKVTQMDGVLFRLTQTQKYAYLQKIKNHLIDCQIAFEIRTEYQQIWYVIQIVSCYQRRQKIIDKSIKQYVYDQLHGNALIIAKFQQLDLDFRFITKDKIQNYTVILYKQVFNQSNPFVPPLGEKITNWSDQYYQVILDNFIKKIMRTDFTNISYFFSTNASLYTKFELDLIFIVQNWNIYSSKLADKMKEVQNLIDFKVFTMKNYQVIYPNIEQISLLIQLRTGCVGFRKYVKKSATDDITDTLYNNFSQQLQARILRHSPFYLKNQQNGAKILLADLIASKTQYDSQTIQNVHWQDIFNRLRLHIKRGASQNKLVDEKVSNDQKAYFEFMNNIEKQRLLDLGCVSCCPIFYTDYNVFDPLVNKTPIELVQKITKVTDLQNDVKDKICYLLNNKGGVILFDVARKYRDYIPMGEIFTKKDQQAYTQKIQAIIETITPKPIIRQNIEISFVPLVKNPMLNPIKQKIQAKKTEASFETIYLTRPYIQGMFVTRIKVKPTTPWLTYYWTSGEKINVPQKVDSLTIKAMQGRKIHKYMTEKFKLYYIPEELAEQQKQIKELFMPSISCFHPGKCMDPDEGLPIYQIKVKSQSYEKPELKYKYMSLLIARKNDHHTIKQRLRRRGIECEIVLLYKDRNFKAANNSAAIYHDVRFDYLLSEISYNRDFQFAGRYAMVIFISQFLKMPEYHSKSYMSQASFKNLQAWIKQYHPEEQIEFWSYDNDGVKQFYLETKSQKSTVLMYYVMTQFGQKCIFKNPKNYDRLTPQQRQSRRKVYYQCNSNTPKPLNEGPSSQVQKILYSKQLIFQNYEEFWHEQSIEQQNYSISGSINKNWPTVDLF